MTDIFQEVEEDVRRERFEKIWKQYGDYIIAGVAAVAIAVAGVNLYLRYEYQQRLNASKTFTVAQDAADNGNATAAAATFAKLAKSAPGGYATLSQLAEANSLLQANNRAEALTLYKAIADKDKSDIGNVARVRAAWIMVEFQPKSDVEQILAPLTASTSQWRFMAQEILAYADYRAGAMGAAQKEFEALKDDKDAPRPLRARANAMAVFLKAGGDANVGTVPKPVPPPTAPDQQGAPQGQPAPEGQPSP